MHIFQYSIILKLKAAFTSANRITKPDPNPCTKLHLNLRHMLRLYVKNVPYKIIEYIQIQGKLYIILQLLFPLKNNFASRASV